MYCAMAIRASFSCMVPNESRRRPNWIREEQCSTALWMLAFIVPERHAAMPNRPLLRMFIATLNPPPSTTQATVHITGNRSHHLTFLIVTTQSLITATTNVLRPSCRPTCVSRHYQLKSGGFCQRSFTAHISLADSNSTFLHCQVPSTLSVWTCRSNE